MSARIIKASSDESISSSTTEDDDASYSDEYDQENKSEVEVENEEEEEEEEKEEKHRTIDRKYVEHRVTMLSNKSKTSNPSHRYSKIRTKDGGFQRFSHSSSSRPTSKASNFQDKGSSLRKRIGSAQKRFDNQLRNDIGILMKKLEDATLENKTLKRVVVKQEKELLKFTNTESELPVILNAHNEEIRVLRSKMKQAQESSKKMLEKLKEKDKQLMQLRDNNKELTKLNKEKKLDERVVLAAELTDVRERLEIRDVQYRDLIHRQDVLERSNKQQLAAEIKRKKEAKRKLKEAEERIQQLEEILVEKEKKLNRMNIYSRGDGYRYNQMKISSSTGNLSQRDTTGMKSLLNSRAELKVKKHQKGNSFAVISNDLENKEENDNDLTVRPEKKEQNPIPKTPKPSKQIEIVENPNVKVEASPEIDFFDDVIDDTPTDDETIINSVHIDENYDEDFEDAFEVHEKDDDSVQDSSEEDKSESSLPRKKHDEAEVENDSNYENGTFSSIRDFFEHNGPIKLKDLTPKVKMTKFDEKNSESPRNALVTPTPEDKVRLWLPAESSPNDEGSEVNLLENVLSNGTDKEVHLNESKEESYFTENHLELNSIPNDELISTLSSKHSSMESNNSHRRHNLMKELFGTDSILVNTSKPLKTSFRSSAGGLKSVKFSEENIESFDFRDPDLRPRSTPHIYQQSF